jgi:hypothetical protein
LAFQPKFAVVLLKSEAIMPNTKRPTSEKQRAANCANAAKSTGPKTPEGKSRSSQNAVKHGFTASTFAVVRLEDLQEIANLKADLVSVYEPANSQELFALERMALAQQSILRAARLEAGLFTTCMNDALDGHDHMFRPMNKELAGDGDIEITRAQNRNYCFADGFEVQARKSNIWSLFLRYQAQAERQYRRALEDFDRLKALRHEFPIQAIPNEPILTQLAEESTPPVTPAVLPPVLFPPAPPLSEPPPQHPYAPAHPGLTPPASIPNLPAQ